jgi:hypothetical protein
VEFNMEKLENYNWNYLDFYVCTRGEQVSWGGGVVEGGGRSQEVGRGKYCRARD